jgi:hypothetical protein
MTEAFWAALEAELAEWSAERPACLWWRDDDTEGPSPSLDRLLALSQAADAPVALAVVPKRMAAALPGRVGAAPRASVIQHGYAHVNHAPPVKGAGAWELGAHRPAETVLGELELGLKLLRANFGAAFQPVLVPPWNRIDDAVVRGLSDLGYRGISLFGPRPQPEAARPASSPIIGPWTRTPGPFSKR